MHVRPLGSAYTPLRAHSALNEELLLRAHLALSFFFLELIRLSTSSYYVDMVAGTRNSSSEHPTVRTPASPARKTTDPNTAAWIHGWLQGFPELFPNASPNRPMTSHRSSSFWALARMLHSSGGKATKRRRPYVYRNQRSPCKDDSTRRQSTLPIPEVKVTVSLELLPL